MISVASIATVLLMVRLVVAIAFGFSSFNKFKNLKKAAKQNEMPLPVMAFAATAEGAGALGLATGILGQYAALGLILIMIGTLSLHIFVWKSPYWAEKGGWEYDLMLLTFCSVIMVFGVGAFAL